MKKRKAKTLLTITSLLLIITLFVTALVYKRGAAPAPVDGLTAETCYSQMNLSWDKNSRAKGYYVYMSEDGENFEQVGETDADTCSYTIKDYDHDKDYYLKVSAFAKNILTGKRSEGEPSEALNAIYDSSQYAQKIPIITYHQVAPDGSDINASLEVYESDFEEQMKYLHDNDYTTLTPDEFYQWHAGTKEFPVKSVMITFDDGFRGVYDLAYPILKKYDQAGTLFCIGKNTFNTGKDNSATYVKEDVIEKVREEYPRFSFESHTYDMHERVDGKVPANSFSLEQIKEDCEKNAALEFTYLAYPWGNYSETMQEALKECDYKMAFAYRPFFYALRSDDTYAINRVKIRGDLPMDTFITIVEGKSESRDNPDAPENQS